MLVQPFVEMDEDVRQRVARRLDRGREEQRALAPDIGNLLGVVRVGKVVLQAERGQHVARQVLLVDLARPVAANQVDAAVERGPQVFVDQRRHRVPACLDQLVRRGRKAPGRRRAQGQDEIAKALGALGRVHAIDAGQACGDPRQRRLDERDHVGPHQPVRAAPRLHLGDRLLDDRLDQMQLVVGERLSRHERREKLLQLAVPLPLGHDQRVLEEDRPLLLAGHHEIG
jgi:hypothetical protein